MKYTRIIIAFLLIAIISIGIVGCTTLAGATTDLMDGVVSQNVYGRPVDNEFIAPMADFSINLFQQSIADDENSLISPLSVMLALAMTTNGADGETLTELEALLGGGMPIDLLNEYLYSYVNRLPSQENAKLSIANSIWFRDDESLNVVPEFLQVNADFYRAQIYRAAFDERTVSDINGWVYENTDGMIDDIIEGISVDTVMFLINAVAFDAEWARIFTEDNVREGDFTDIHGNNQRVEFMHSTEHRFIEDGKATGFIKPYAGGSYSFVALLPNEDVSIDEYIQSLTGSGFIEMLENMRSVDVVASMPKFEFEFDLSMVDALKALGVEAAFNNEMADFSEMATSANGNIFIDDVIHKTFISVDERGTRAGAATMVVMRAESAPAEIKFVRLDRPFVFAIVDSSTNLPIFIGAVLTV